MRGPLNVISNYLIKYHHRSPIHRTQVGLQPKSHFIYLCNKDKYCIL